MSFDEYRVRDLQRGRLREAQTRRMVAGARAGRDRGVRVWNIGVFVVAWKPRQRRFDGHQAETPIIVWV